MIFISCEKDEINQINTPITCNCMQQTWVRQINPIMTQWNFNGNSIFYSNDCDDNNKIVGGYSGNGLEIQYRIKCN